MYCIILLILVIIFALFFECNSIHDLTLGNMEKLEWRSLTDNELGLWYSKVDLCMLNQTELYKFPGVIRREKCGWIRGQQSACGVGMGTIGEPCHSPYAGRTSYRKGVKGYTNALHTPLIDAFSNLKKANAVLVLVGDSTMRQKLQAIECEIRREDRNIKVQGWFRAVLPCHTKLKITFKDGNFTEVHGLSIGPNSANCLVGGLGYSAPYDGIFEHAEHFIKGINFNESKSVLVVANAGLWYNNEAKFSYAMPGVLQWLHNVHKLKNASNIVAWHETMSQHWESVTGNGYYLKEISDRIEYLWLNGSIDLTKMTPQEVHVPTCCHKISNYTEPADWRNYIIKQFIRSNPEYSNDILYFPFADATKETPDMHTCHLKYKHDCTHYCFWPLLYQPLWHQINKASENLLLKFQSISVT